jgi:hypothetical protein
MFELFSMFQVKHNKKPTLRYHEGRLHPLRSREATSQVGSDYVASDQSLPVCDSPTLGLTKETTQYHAAMDFHTARVILEKRKAPYDWGWTFDFLHKVHDDLSLENERKNHTGFAREDSSAYSQGRSEIVQGWDRRSPTVGLPGENEITLMSTIWCQLTVSDLLSLLANKKISETSPRFIWHIFNGELHYRIGMANYADECVLLPDAWRFKCKYSAIEIVQECIRIIQICLPNEDHIPPELPSVGGLKAPNPGSNLRLKSETAVIGCILSMHVLHEHRTELQLDYVDIPVESTKLRAFISSHIRDYFYLGHYEIRYRFPAENRSSGYA